MAEPKVGAVEDPEGKYFRIVVEMPKTVTLQEDWNNLIWDECLRQAHAKMLMPVGPVIISDPVDIEPDTGQAQRALPEGIRFDVQPGSRINMDAFMEGFVGAPVEVSVAMVRVEAEVSLMGSV